MNISNQEGIRNLCAIASKILKECDVNAATKFAVRTVLREAVNKSCPRYRGNNNKLNVKYVSVKANLEIKRKSGRKLVADHVVPLSLLFQDIYDKKVMETNELIIICKDYSDMCLITKQEDINLTNLKLKQKMPVDWDKKDKLARYKAAEILFKAK